MKDRMILGANSAYSLNDYSTRRNNNVLIVGTSGAGKTRGIVTPNLLEATGSYIISDPKGNLFSKYARYLCERGYAVRKLDFIHPDYSAHYNFFNYIHNRMDVIRVARLLNGKISLHADPFWDHAAEMLLTALIAYIWETQQRQFMSLHGIMQLIDECSIVEGRDDETTLDIRFKALRAVNPNSWAYAEYRGFRCGASRTLKSVLITLNAKLRIYDIPEITNMMSRDELNLDKFGERKNALFVVVSDMDRSMDNLVNIFLSQAMQELCNEADYHSPGNRLRVPVRFILDDFATNCRIDEFPRIIAAIRSRGISTTLIVQAESQLRQGYGEDATTIIGNCDTYVYMGGTDTDTCQQIALRCDVPLADILYMPVGKEWIFRRGDQPKLDDVLDLDDYLRSRSQVHIQEVDRMKLNAG